jgi:hypothetical protein
MLIYDLAAGGGNWSLPYRQNGYEVRCVDILNGQDVRLLKVPSEPVHGVLAAPPCTHLCNSGRGSWETKGVAALRDALSIVDACLRFIMVTQPKWWALENPPGRINHYLGPPKMRFHPKDFGDDYLKKTNLWGSFEEPKRCPWGHPDSPFNDSYDGYTDYIYSRTGKDSALKSVTPLGFAWAFYRANP